MRHKNETATSFDKLREITQAIDTGAKKPNGTAHAKKSALNPTKRAFSERQRTTIRDNSQAKEIKRDN